MDCERGSAFMHSALRKDARLRQHPGRILISVDTFHADVAAQAVVAGADIVNDVSGGSLDASMYSEVCLHTPAALPAG